MNFLHSPKVDLRFEPQVAVHNPQQSAKNPGSQQILYMGPGLISLDVGEAM